MTKITKRNELGKVFNQMQVYLWTLKNVMKHTLSEIESKRVEDISTLLMEFKDGCVVIKQRSWTPITYKHNFYNVESLEDLLYDDIQRHQNFVITRYKDYTYTEYVTKYNLHVISRIKSEDVFGADGMTIIKGEFDLMERSESDPNHIITGADNIMLQLNDCYVPFNCKAKLDEIKDLEFVECLSIFDITEDLLQVSKNIIITSDANKTLLQFTRDLINNSTPSQKF